MDWLRQVSTWSAQRPTHSPITIGLDIAALPIAGAPPSYELQSCRPSLVERSHLLATHGAGKPSVSIYIRDQIYYIYGAQTSIRPQCHPCVYGAQTSMRWCARSSRASSRPPSWRCTAIRWAGQAGLWSTTSGQGPQYTLTPLGTASPSPSPSPPRHPSPSALLATLAPPRTLHPPPRIGLIHLTFHTLHTLHTPQVLFVLTGDIPTRLAYLDHFSYSASEPTSYNTSEPTEFSGAFFSEFTPGYPEVLMEATTPPPPLPPTRR